MFSGFKSLWLLVSGQQSLTCKPDVASVEVFHREDELLEVLEDLGDVQFPL